MNFYVLASGFKKGSAANKKIENKTSELTKLFIWCLKRNQNAVAINEDSFFVIYCRLSVY